MNKKISLGTAIALSLIMIAATFSITMVYSSNTFSERMKSITEREAMYSKLQEIDNLVRSNYYGDLDDELLMDSISRGYALGMGDLYSQYFTAEEYAKISQDLNGRIVTIGIESVMDSSGYIYITDVYPDSPAQNAGIQRGDMIVKVEDLDISADTYEQAIAMMDGETGTKVKIVVRRQADDIELDITRRAVEVPTVTYSIIDGYGYININSFANNSTLHFDNAISAVIAEGVSGLIFDVRDNPGGTLDSTCEILDRLLPEGPIASATYNDGTTELISSSDASEIDMPMVVLTNNNTASAAELFVQALKDYNKATSVGTTTYGKGVMQSIVKLTDGSAFELTIAAFNPPYSENFDLIGVKPDYEVKLTAEQQAALIFNDFSDDPQIAKAKEVLASELRAEGATPPASESSSEQIPPEDDTEDSSSQSEDDESSDSSSEDGENADVESSSESEEDESSDSSEDNEESTEEDASSDSE